MTASKSHLEMNAAAVLAGFSRPAYDNPRQMFGEMEMTFPMKVSLPSKRLKFPSSLMFYH
jgi:hypothetical protein